MASQYFAILTDYGTRAIAHALSQGQPLQLAKFAVGDGNGQAVTPTASATALVHQTHSAPVSAVSLDPRNNKQVIVELTIPENVGGFYIREMGVFDAQNKLIAYANCPESFKPTESSGSGKVQVLRMILKVESSSAVTLSIDHSVIFITRQQMTPKTITATSTNGVDERGHSHEIAKASLTQQGIVQLDSSTNSNAEDKAATPKAVKTVKDQVDNVQRNQANYIHNSKKSSAVDSNSEDTVANSAAVKTAYDKGVDAKTAADNAQRTANDGVSKANAAQTSANQAKSAADAAQHTANDGVSKATAAQTSANQAKSAADAAQHTANDGVSKANAAQISANQAKSAADAAQSSANAANNNANGRISKTDISHATNGTNKAKVASEFALNELNKKLSTVIRKNYTKTIKGTNASFDNATQKNINLEGETIIHPDGKVEQIIHFKAFRVWWFYLEAKNNSERLAVEIPVPLWTAMPNKITNVTATFSRTESGRSFSFGAEAFEWWPPSWAFERQNNIKDRLWLYTIRHVGNQDEHIDLWVKVEGY